MWYSKTQLWSRLGTMRPQLQILRWHCPGQDCAYDPDAGKALRWFWSDAKWPVDPLRTLARDGLPRTNAGYTYPLLSLLSRPDWFPSLPPMWENSRTGIPALLWPLRAMLGLERFLQSNDYPASEIILTATYLLIRPASFTCWLLLACPFPLLSIFLHFPIDFLFADFLYWVALLTKRPLSAADFVFTVSGLRRTALHWYYVVTYRCP